jgi:hypothetical protein
MTALNREPTMTTFESADSAPDSRVAWGNRPVTSIWLWVALGVAAVAVAGSLTLSLGLNLKACPLCFYQRAFAMSALAVLGMGIAAGLGRSGSLAFVALPLAVAGLGVAVFHTWLEGSGKLECPPGLLGLGTAPQQSLIIFVLLGRSGGEGGSVAGPLGRRGGRRRPGSAAGGGILHRQSAHGSRAGLGQTARCLPATVPSPAGTLNTEVAGWISPDSNR